MLKETQVKQLIEQIPPNTNGFLASDYAINRFLTKLAENPSRDSGARPLIEIVALSGFLYPDVDLTFNVMPGSINHEALTADFVQQTQTLIDGRFIGVSGQSQKYTKFSRSLRVYNNEAHLRQGHRNAGKNFGHIHTLNEENLTFTAYSVIITPFHTSSLVGAYLIDLYNRQHPNTPLTYPL